MNTRLIQLIDFRDKIASWVRISWTHTLRGKHYYHALRFIGKQKAPTSSGPFNREWNAVWPPEWRECTLVAAQSQMCEPLCMHMNVWCNLSAFLELQSVYRWIMRTVWISLASMTMDRRAALDLDFARRTCISLARPFHLSAEQFDPNYLLRASTVPN